MVEATGSKQSFKKRSAEDAGVATDFSQMQNKRFKMSSNYQVVD